MTYEDADLVDVAEAAVVPDLVRLSDRLKAPLALSETVSRDWTKLFDPRLFQLDWNVVPAAASLYPQLGVKKEVLTLISPQLESPLPPLTPATFPPVHLDPSPPALELYDLDDEFAIEHVKLAQLTSKCRKGGLADVDYYIKEASKIVGVKVPGAKGRSAKALLAHIFAEICHYKLPHEGTV